MSKFNELSNLVSGLDGDFEAFYGKGNKAAGRRIRGAMQDLKKVAQDIRIDIQNKVNADKAK